MTSDSLPEQEVMSSMPLKKLFGRKHRLIGIAVLVCLPLLIPSIRLTFLLATATNMTFSPTSMGEMTGAPMRSTAFNSSQNADSFTLLRDLRGKFGLRPIYIDMVYYVDVQSLGFIHWRLVYTPELGRITYDPGLFWLPHQKYVAYLSFNDFMTLNRQIGFVISRSLADQQEAYHRNHPK